MIEGLDFPHSSPAATCQVTEISGAQSRKLLKKLPSQRHILQLQWPDLYPGFRDER